MTPPRTLKKLTELFSLVGAKKPESWARSQLEEGIPQLHRFLFLRQAWARVVAEDDREWIDSARHWAKQDPDGPGAGVGHSLERLLKAGASPDDLTELVRGMQWRLLFDLCYMLEDPAFVEDELDGFGVGAGRDGCARRAYRRGHWRPARIRAGNGSRRPRDAAKAWALKGCLGSGDASPCKLIDHEKSSRRLGAHPGLPVLSRQHDLAGRRC
ncbi:hypothetical protein Ddc_20431 [Ditylenchus destructor]|nr:hypothetical protein Ddc_20431 [Ditylenchus destructor]